MAINELNPFYTKHCSLDFTAGGCRNMAFCTKSTPLLSKMPRPRLHVDKNLETFCINSICAAAGGKLNAPMPHRSKIYDCFNSSSSTTTTSSSTNLISHQNDV
eukprot:c47314_g1_i1 orf=202-510(+)